MEAKQRNVKSASPTKAKEPKALSSSALQSPSGSRKPSARPLSTSQSHKPGLASSPTAASLNRKRSSGKGTLTNFALGENIGDTERSLQLVLSHPIMKVADTVFDTTGPNSGKVSPSQSSAMTTSEGATSTKKSDHKQTGASSPMMKTSSADITTPTAMSMKRAAMWQTILVTALIHTSMTEQFRELRLRKALERHLLPVLLKRKEETGSILNREYVRDTPAGKPTAGENEVIQGSYLKENDGFFQSLNNSVLLQSLAEKMTRHRYRSSEVIVKPDDYSQQRMYFIISGKVEFRRDDSFFENPVEETVLPAKRVLLPGESFGGIFACPTQFGGMYRALSPCLIWTLEAEDFESVFRPFADQNMRDTYKAALKEKHLEWMRQKYNLAALPSRMPIYRHLTSILPHKKYAEDFEADVMMRGDVLFEEGDAAGDVFCLLEGQVQRSVRGIDGTYSSGVSQVLGLTEYGVFNRTGRLILLGEEPHLLPGSQRYRCSIASRSAILLRIKKASFLNALLDEPSYLLQIREKLVQLYLSEMKLDPQCLNFVPLLKGLSETSLATLTKEAKPVIVQRSVALCEPAQHIKEIFLIVRGDVRDSRTFGHQPTERLPTPPPTVLSSEDEGGEKNKGKKEKKVVARVHKAVSVAPTDVEEPQLEWSFSFHEFGKGESEAEATAYTVINPDEQSDLNPPLPLPPAKRFSVTLGGSWEGLLVDKWPYGWEATSTVAAWTIPTLQIRTEYNSCPKSVQNTILQGARLRQKEELELPEVKVEKLPPMTVYQTDPKVGYVTAPGGTAAKGSRASSSSKRSASKGRKADMEDSVSAAEEMPSGYLYSGSVLYSEGNTASKARQSSARRKSKTTKKDPSVALPKEKAATPKKVKPKTTPTPKKKSEVLPPVEEVLPPPSKKAPLQHFNYSIKTTKEQEEVKEVAPHLLAMYNGEFKNDDPAVINIIRDPAPAPKKSKKAKAANTNTGNAPGEWPASDSSKQRWFKEVPSYEPLPGTTQNVNMAVPVPEYKSNTTYMTKRGGKNYRENLNGTVDYMNSTNARKAEKGEETVPVKTHSVNPKRYVPK